MIHEKTKVQKSHATVPLMQLYPTNLFSAEIRSVPTSNSVLLLEPESQLVPDHTLPELVEVVQVVGPGGPSRTVTPVTLQVDRQTGPQQHNSQADRQKAGSSESLPYLTTVPKVEGQGGGYERLLFMGFF